MKNVLSGIIFILIIAMAGSIYAETPYEFDQVGYFKDAQKNRIFTYTYHSGTPKQAIIEHAMKRRNTDRRMTTAYYFLEGSAAPGDGITLSKNIFRANHILYEMQGISGWRYAFMISFNGQSNFVDCSETPGNELCRQK